MARKRVIVVETHNTGIPERKWKRGAVPVPDGDYLIERNGPTNVRESDILLNIRDPQTKAVSFKLTPPLPHRFDDDLRALLGNNIFFNVSWFYADW